MISKNIQYINSQLPPTTRLVCVSKFKPVEAIQEAYTAGQRVFGESKVQELCTKAEQLPADIEWHFIGHLQTNKVKHLLPVVSLIHGVDSEHLLTEINKQAEKIGKKMRCLLEIHIAQEEAKYGFSTEELIAFFQKGNWRELKNISFCGLMGMASNTDDENQIRKEFRGLKTLFDKLKIEYFPENTDFKELSMGMSGDYQIAVEEGSTLIRIGSFIFGER